MSRLTRDGTAEPVSRNQILSRERGQGKVHFSCPAHHVQDCQPYPVDPCSCYICVTIRSSTTTAVHYFEKLTTKRNSNTACCCCCCCCCLHIKSRSGLYSVLSNIRTGPTDADAFRGHRLTTQKGYTYQKEIIGPRKVSTHAIIGK